MSEALFTDMTDCLNKPLELPIDRSRTISLLQRSPRVSWTGDNPVRCELTVRILSCKDLPRTDLIGHSDPYVVMTVGSADEALKFKTHTVYNTGNPSWDDEYFEFAGVPQECPINFQVFDKDSLTADDFIGSAQVMFSTAKYGTHGVGSDWTLGLTTSRGKWTGSVTVQICWRYSASDVHQLLHMGPVRYRVCLSGWTGALTGDNGNKWRAFAAHKLRLCSVRQFFPEGESAAWNRDYDKACMIFQNALVKTGVQTQHYMLYTDSGKSEHRGVLRCQADVMALLWAGEPRYYTYVLMQDSLRFSETGAAFFKDMFSKHAMHAGCAESVVCAGEFLLLQDKLVFDNNSGTYAHGKDRLLQLQALLRFNIPDIRVEVVSVDEPMLKEYHSLVPSRLK